MQIKKIQIIKDDFLGFLFDKNFGLSKMILFKNIMSNTMVGYKRLSNVYELTQSIEKNRTKGDFVECGVYKGGCAAIMAYICKKNNSPKKIWLFDSFKGLPEPTKSDGIKAVEYASNKSSGKLQSIDKCVATLNDVKKLFFSKLKIDRKNVIIKEGWFQDTLPVSKKEIGDIALLRLDGDWYESTKCCLDNLYDNVIAGGYVILDDYGLWEGARKALIDFMEKRKINPVLKKIDYTGIYFQKP